ncbi:MAG: linear amide C-N hydrolase [Chitinophagaceae bacterium]|nr:MAG: linear amide C-N hydrolase [Chitinophagaceae bacterium]
MKKLLLLVLTALASCFSFACTTFLLNKNGQLVFGRNYDWITGAGMINTNQRGLFKFAAEANENKMAWVSLNGSITFNQYGKEFPTGGMNEQGLVVELMWLEGTQYSPVDERPAIGVLQWIQYQLDMHSTIEEVILSDKKIRINTTSTPLHFLVADGKGNAASIEFLNGQMKVHRGNELPFAVLTNDPYQKSKEAAVSAMNDKKLSGNNSLDRFVTACSMVNKLSNTDISTPLTDYAFSILNKVSQGDFTKWSIVYDISNKQVFFKTSEFNTLKWFSFSSFDFTCITAPQMFNMNQPGQGNISTRFTAIDSVTRLAIINKAVVESKAYVAITDAEKQLLLEFADKIHCN